MEASTPPSAFRRFLGAPFLAGLLGGGAALWWVGLLAGLSDAEIIDESRGRMVIAGVVAAVVLGMTRGYATRVASYPALVGRLVGGSLFGALLAVGVVAAAHSFVHGEGARRVTVTLAGAACAALAVARLDGRRLVAALRAGAAARGKAGAAAALLALATAWCLSAGVRCRLGSGASCRAAGGDADDDGDVRGAVDLFERGCAHGDAVSCRLAAYRVRRVDPARAEDLLRDGCLLGDPRACGQVHAQRLEQRCDGYSASACRQLAEAYARGDAVMRDPTAASRLFQKACRLGDGDACQR